MCTHVAHHLDDEQVERFLDELARVTRRGIVVQDAISGAGLASRLLWILDKGSHPRSRARLLELITRRFTIDHAEEYSRFHRYLLLVARPKESFP